MFAEMLIQGNMTPEVMVTAHALDAYTFWFCRKQRTWLFTSAGKILMFLFILYSVH